MIVVRAAEIPFTPASHEDPQNPGVFKRVLANQDAFISGRPQMINWAKMPVGASFQRHYHEDMQEAFIIVTGEVEIHVGLEQQLLQAGDLVLIPPKAVHQMKNVGSCDVEYLVVGISSGEGGQTVVVQ